MEEKKRKDHDHEHEHNHEHHHGASSKMEKILTVVGVVIFIAAFVLQKNSEIVGMVLFGISYILIGYEIIWNAVSKLFRRDMFDENFLMTVATLGAFAIGDYAEGVAVLLFYKVGELLQDKAVENSKKKIEKVLDIRSEYANLVVGNSTQKVDPKTVKVDDMIVVKTGEKIPLDGIVLDGESSLDTAALTGESKPLKVTKESTVLSGCINLGAVLTIQVTKTYETSTVSKMIKLIQNAAANKSSTEKYITRFAKIYTPIVTLMAVLIAIIFPFALHISFGEALIRALTFLVVSCPCALVVSVPLGFFMGIGACSKKGILVKGSNYLDLLTQTKTVLFDKTGTLTKGDFTISHVAVQSSKISKEDMLEKLTLCETLSNHYIATSIVSHYTGKLDKNKIGNHEEFSGLGIKAFIENQEVLVGNEKLLENNQIVFDKVDTNETIVYIAMDQEYVGYITLADQLKEDAHLIADQLKKAGIEKTILLTGDRKEFATEIGKTLHLDEVYSELLPEDKMKQLEQIKSQTAGKVAYVGDGINDGPVIAGADVGIAMGKGSDLAIETADIVLMSDEPSKIVESIRIAKRTKHIVKQNITIVLIVKVIFLILSGFGISTMWEAVFADVGISLLAILNSLRIYQVKK